MKNITDEFLDALETCIYRPLTAEVITQVKYCLADYLACAYLGAGMVQENCEAYLSMFPKDCGTSTIIGRGTMTDEHIAAMWNGINSHVAELDDGHRFGMLHLAAPVFSALIPVAQNREMSADNFIRGVVAGYEATIRLASAIQPGHKLKGYHATATCGTIGTAYGIAVALGYGKEKIKATISAAATDAAGLLQVIDDTSQLKPYNIGRAAVAAVNAAAMGVSGLVGPEDVLGGKRGFFQTTAKDVQTHYLLNGFDEKYAIELIYRKPYAACRHCHSPIECALRIRGQSQIEVHEIQDILVETYGLAVRGHEHTDICGVSSAKMSTPYSVAVALKYGSAGFQQFGEEYIRDPEVQALCRKVRVVEDEHLSELVPAQRAAKVTVQTTMGNYESYVAYPKGEPENPISERELREKYDSLMQAAGMDTDEAERLWDVVMKLEQGLEPFFAMI